jgi:hypothetical protein
MHVYNVEGTELFIMQNYRILFYLFEYKTYVIDKVLWPNSNVKYIHGLTVRNDYTRTTNEFLRFLKFSLSLFLKIK